MFQNGIFSFFFFKSLSQWQKAKATGRTGDSGEDAGQCLCADCLPCPSTENSASTDHLYGSNQGHMVSQMVSPSSKTHTQMVSRVSRAHSQRAATPASFVPVPTLAESCFALWKQVFQIYPNWNLGGSSSAFSICAPASFWSLDSSSRK